MSAMALSVPREWSRWTIKSGDGWTLAASCRPAQDPEPLDIVLVREADAETGDEGDVLVIPLATMNARALAAQLLIVADLAEALASAPEAKA